MRYLYVSEPGGKPLNVGMNRAKRVARHADKRDQRSVLKELGPGLPRQHQYHQRLVKSRHGYYGDIYDEQQRVRLETQEPRGAGADTADAHDPDRAVPEPAAGADLE